MDTPEARPAHRRGSAASGRWPRPRIPPAGQHGRGSHRSGQGRSAEQAKTTASRRKSAGGDCSRLAPPVRGLRLIRWSRTAAPSGQSREPAGREIATRCDFGVICSMTIVSARSLLRCLPRFMDAHHAHSPGFDIAVPGCRRRSRRSPLSGCSGKSSRRSSAVSAIASGSLDRLVERLAIARRPKLPMATARWLTKNKAVDAV